MTVCAYLVIVTSWSASKVTKALDAVAGVGRRSAASERKRQRIVTAATELFTDQGYRKTSIDEVARHAGVAKGTVYLYAKNKADLLIQVLSEEKRRSMTLFADVLAPGVPARERLRRWVKANITLAPQLPLSARLLSGDRELLLALEELDPAHRKSLEKTGDDLLSALLAEAARPVKLPKAALKERSQVLQALMLTVLMADERAHGGLAIERYAELMADLVLDGVLAAPNAAPPKSNRR